MVLVFYQLVQVLLQYRDAHGLLFFSTIELLDLIGVVLNYAKLFLDQQLLLEYFLLALVLFIL